MAWSFAHLENVWFRKKRKRWSFCKVNWRGPCKHSRCSSRMGDPNTNISNPKKKRESQASLNHLPMPSSPHPSCTCLLQGPSSSPYVQTPFIFPSRGNMNTHEDHEIIIITWRLIRRCAARFLNLLQASNFAPSSLNSYHCNACTTKGMIVTPTMTTRVQNEQETNASLLSTGKM